MTYLKKLQDPRWQKKRLKILERDQFTCQMCKDDKDTLHIHHLKYSGQPWEADDSDLITLCKYCHETVEMYRLDVIPKAYKRNDAEISFDKYDKIVITFKTDESYISVYYDIHTGDYHHDNSIFLDDIKRIKEIHNG